MFTAAEIRERAMRVPFTPFRISTSGGVDHDITHPELIFVGRREVQIGIGTPDEPLYFDRLLRVAIMHITEVMDLPVGQPVTGGNGEAP